jgi:hypothetical protein
MIKVLLLEANAVILPLFVPGYWGRKNIPFSD